MVSSEFCSKGRVSFHFISFDYHQMKVSRIDTGKVLLFLPLDAVVGLANKL